MANFASSFLNGADLEISIGDHTIAFATDLMIEETVIHAPVGGMGSYSHSAIEPLQYIVRGSFSITHYTRLVADALSDASRIPYRVKKDAGPVSNVGNTFLEPSQFSPAHLFASRTFDITVKERKVDSSLMTDGTTNPIKTVTDVFKLHDCRMTNYSLSFSPGRIVTENIAFMAIYAEDAIAR